MEDELKAIQELSDGGSEEFGGLLSRILRFIRGAVGLGVAFSVAVTIVFTVISVIKWLNGADLINELIETVLTGAAPLGFLMGVAFSVVLAVGGRGQPLSDVSVGCFLKWGALGGVVFWVVSGGPFSVPDLPEAVAELGVSAVLGVLVSAGVYGVAGIGRDSSRLDSGEPLEGRLGDSPAPAQLDDRV